MSRDPIALTLTDVSSFARALGAELGDAAPGHQSLLNLIARAGGYRNFQHLRATQSPAAPAAPADGRAVSRALARFDAAGRMTGWSTRRKTRQLCLWALWAQLPSGEIGNEAAVSARFDAMTTFRDAAQIRRSLVEDGLVARNRDGSLYRRLAATPDETARAVIRGVALRVKARAPAG